MVGRPRARCRTRLSSVAFLLQPRRRRWNTSPASSYEFFVCLGARNAGLFLRRWLLIQDALLIEREQAVENLFVGHGDRGAGRGGDGGTEFGVDVGEPGGTFVVEIS